MVASYFRQAYTKIREKQAARRCAHYLLGHHIAQVKITIISLLLVSSTIGCSRKSISEGQVVLKQGDVASFAVVSTNQFGGRDVYLVHITFSTTGQGAIREFEQNHRSSHIELSTDSQAIVTIRNPASWRQESPISLSIGCDSLDEAQHVAEAFDKLREK